MDNLSYSSTKQTRIHAARLRSHLPFDIAVGVAMLALSIVVNFYAGTFATAAASNPVTDIILDNIPVFNVNFIFSTCPLLLWMFVAALLIARPERTPFVLKSLALFIVVRAGFITLTHVAPFPIASRLTLSAPMRLFTFGGDLFFSGHTGSPFLLALIFWKDRWLRLTFLAATALFGTAVLLGHLHYSIDVFAALFISYGIHDLAKFAFRREWMLCDCARGAGHHWQLASLTRRLPSLPEMGVEYKAGRHEKSS